MKLTLISLLFLGMTVEAAENKVTAESCNVNTATPSIQCALIATTAHGAVQALVNTKSRTCNVQVLKETDQIINQGFRDYTEVISYAGNAKISEKEALELKIEGLKFLKLRNMQRTIIEVRSKLDRVQIVNCLNNLKDMYRNELSRTK